MTAGSKATPSGEAKLKGTISNRRAPGSQRVQCGVAGGMGSAGDREGTSREFGQCTCQRTVAYLNPQRLRPLIPAVISVFGRSTLLALQYYSVAPSSERPPTGPVALAQHPPRTSNFLTCTPSFRWACTDSARYCRKDAPPTYVEAHVLHLHCHQPTHKNRSQGLRSCRLVDTLQSS